MAIGKDEKEWLEKWRYKIISYSRENFKNIFKTKNKSLDGGNRRNIGSKRDT